MPFLTTSTLTDAPMHTPKATKRETLNSPNTTPSISCPLPVQCGGRRPPESLADALQDWSTSEVFSSRTVLTENICRRVQEIFKNNNNKWPGNNGLSNNPQNNPFLPGYSSSPGWLLVTRTRGAWWCRYRGHWRSGPRHLSPRSRVCAQEWHPKDIHSHIHSHPPMRAPKANEEQNPQLTKHDCFLYLSSSCPMRWGSTARTTAWQTLLGTAPRRRPSRLGQYWQKTFVDVFNTYS